MPSDLRRRTYSEETAVLIDSEVRRIVNEAHQRARGILVENRDALVRVADTLLEKEALNAEQIQALLTGSLRETDSAVS